MSAEGCEVFAAGFASLVPGFAVVEVASDGWPAASGEYAGGVDPSDVVGLGFGGPPAGGFVGAGGFDTGEVGEGFDFYLDGAAVGL